MPSPAATFVGGSPNPVHNPIKPALLSASLRLSLPPAAASFATASCSLIEPDGGRLINLVAPEGPAQLLQIKLSLIDLEWVHMLSEAWLHEGSRVPVNASFQLSPPRRRLRRQHVSPDRAAHRRRPAKGHRRPAQGCPCRRPGKACGHPDRFISTSKTLYMFCGVPT